MQQKRKIKIFSTLSDVGTLLMSFLYLLYISLLLIMSIGIFWLNIAILALTFVYFMFFILKIFLLNGRLKKAGLGALLLRYAKFLVRLINATIVIISLVNLGLKDGNAIIKIASIIILLVMLAISIAWDVSMIFIKRKIKDLRAEWENLPPEEKQSKLEYLVHKIALSIDGTGDIAKFLTHKET